MAHTAPVPQYRRWLAGVLAVILGFGPIATPSYAAVVVTPLADQPLNAQNQAKPNIVLTVDDSTSMLFDYLPDTVISSYCRGMTGSMAANCGTPGNNTVGKYVSAGHTFQQYGLPFSATNPSFDPSGPGAGCVGANCSPGIDPAPTPVVLAPWTLYPGIERYPLGTAPMAGRPYEYWTLWPAPAHNSEFNHIYYNPRQQYDPPIDGFGNPYPQMDSGTTAGWTRVPADPWAEPWAAPWAPWPPAVRFIDLTAQVTVGLWCNSDWSIGKESNPAYCRTNGTGAGAATSSKSSTDGDYNYPWAPPGIDPSAPPATALSIAYSKVDATTKALLPAWTSAMGRDPKYFYQNDNTLWCDTTSPLWPHHGPPVHQTCNGGSTIQQTCVGRVSQTCNTGTPQTCVGATPDSCQGVRTQTCGPLAHQTCGSPTTQTCVPPPAPHCDGIGTQTCDGVGSQTCDGVTTQTCDNVTGQTCDGVGHQVCNLVSPTCDLTTCAETWEYQDPDTLAWVPDPTSIYCPCVGDECRACRVAACPKKCSSDHSVCVDATTCPSTGTCNIVGNPCTATSEAQCPTQPGICSRDGVHGCRIDNDCAKAGHCSTQTLTLCHTAGPDPSECPLIPGQCSTDAHSCSTPGITPECPNAGHCSIVNTATCYVSGTDLAHCPTQPGQCRSDHATCFADSPDCDRAGHCSSTGAACPPDHCAPVGGACTIDGHVCSIDTDCGDASTCSITGAFCHTAGPDPAECPDLPGACVVSGATCTGAVTDCPPRPDGHCSVSGLTCSTTGGCPNIGQNCSITGEACSPTPYFPYCTWDPDPRTTCAEPSHCPIQGGTCSVDGSPCPLDLGVHYYFGPIWGYTYDLSLCDPAVTHGTCSITGLDCTGTCPDVGGPSGGATCSDKVDDGTRSLFEDANGAGVVCRHNNRLAGAYTSGPYDYPNTTFNTPVTGGTGPNACVASPRYATVPRHYWKTGLEWCDGVITTVGDKWLGYGKRAGATCQDSADSTHVYPRFYKFGQPSTTDNDPTPAFERVDLIPGATYTHDWTDDDGPEHISRSYVEEMTNYANWFAYYRTRIQAVKTVTSASFTEIDAKYRVGFHAMFSLPSFLNVKDFDSAVQKPAWFSKLFGVTIPLGQETPTLTSMARIGDYFLNGGHPQLSGSTDPIQLACQQNFHMLFTDGFTNQNALPTTTVANVDALVPSGPVLSGFPIGLVANPIVGITQGSDWPRPYREDPGATPTLNALSDYAMAYWVTDLRPGMPDTVPTSNDPPVAGDRYSAKWQHLNFAALSLGTSGKLPAGDQVATELALRNPASTLQWPQPQDIHGLPDVLKPDNSGVDDLWHAAMNGHGDFVNADSIEEVKLGIGKILAGVTNLPGTNTSVGFVSNTLGPSANFIYRVRFEQSWSGSLTKIQISPTTGLPLLLPPIWNASDQLTAVTTPADGWRLGRRIVTMKEDGTRIPFLWANLGASQQDSLAPGKPAKGQTVLEFLRGNRAREGEKVGRLRVRASPMGDIVDSSPVYVGAPNAPYLDTSDPGYSGFKSAFAGRLPHLYVGGNDGMLHAFDDANGNERWAYVPTPLFRDGSAAVAVACQASNTAVPCGTAGGDPKTGLGALAYQDGALPAFRHHFYVDATPKIVEVDFNRPAGDQWRTLLVGGMGKGGNRYYALNVTDPGAVTDEASALNQILWEFPPVGDNTLDMGYTYGKPVIAKTNKLFGGAWLVTVGSGYNNPTGEGKLYFLQASNPNPGNYKVMSTGVGTVGKPAGLAHPAAYTQDFHNQLAEQFYAGDLLGDLWRFDVSSDVSAWTVGPLASLIPPGGGSVQPVTTPPEIKIDINNGIDRWVFVGTGKLYDQLDLNDHQQQTMYAFRDGTASAPWALPATPTDRTTLGMVPLPDTDPTNNFGLANIPDKGWWHDLPNGGRIVVAPQAAFGVIAYISTRPQSDDLCATGLPVTIYAREYGTGQSLLTENDDGTGRIVSGIDVAEGGVGLQIVAFQGPDGATTPDVRLAITMPNGSVRYFRPKLPSAFFQHRMSWRLLGQ